MREKNDMSDVEDREYPKKIKNVWSVSFEEPDQDCLTVSDRLGVNCLTARGIIARCIRDNRMTARPRGGRYNVKVKNEMKQCLEAIVNEYCTLTLEAVNTKLQDRLPEMYTVNVRTIAKHLDDTLYTLKLSRQLPAERNTRSHPTLPSIFPVVPRRGQSYPHDLNCIVWV